MKDKINVAELLKDCPQGMELDCTMYDNLHFDKVDDYDKKIHCYIQYKDHRTHIMFGKDGTYNSEKASKCIIFPKGKTTWEGFQRPFKDGDIVVGYNNKPSICKKTNVEKDYRAYCAIDAEGFFYVDNGRVWMSDHSIKRFATEEEKAELFQAIKDNGYRWNAETKTLEELSKFKVGDRIILRNNPHNIPSVRIKAVTKSQYILENEGFFYISSADEKYVLEDKFDITTLKPFESRVLVRTKHFHDKWIAGFFSHKDSDGFAPFWTTADKNYQQCIPYEGNEHLLGKTDDCDEYFKTWK